MIVADSDVLIDALRGRSPAVERIDRELARGSLATTAISVFELRSGAPSEDAEERVEAVLAPLHVLPLDAAAARAASEIRLELESAREDIGMADYLIAGICLVRSATLLTRNRSHFERIDGLVLGTLDARS